MNKLLRIALRGITIALVTLVSLFAVAYAILLLQDKGSSFDIDLDGQRIQLNGCFVAVADEGEVRYFVRKAPSGVFLPFSESGQVKLVIRRVYRQDVHDQEEKYAPFVGSSGLGRGVLLKSKSQFLEILFLGDKKLVDGAQGHVLRQIDRKRFSEVTEKQLVKDYQEDKNFKG